MKNENSGTEIQPRAENPGGNTERSFAVGAPKEAARGNEKGSPRFSRRREPPGLFAALTSLFLVLAFSAALLAAGEPYLGAWAPKEGGKPEAYFIFTEKTMSINVDGKTVLEEPVSYEYVADQKAYKICAIGAAPDGTDDCAFLKMLDDSSMDLDGDVFIRR
jgi:hypothetical protein